MSEDKDFIEPESSEFLRKETTFKDIVMNQFNKCVLLHSRELSSGKVTQRLSKSGELVEHYQEDYMESFVNAVSILHDLLLAYFDDSYTKANETILKEYNDLFNNFEAKEKNEINISVYKKKRYIITRKRFQELSLLLYRLKYFKEEQEDFDNG